jgi:hypothetical protein
MDDVKQTVQEIIKKKRRLQFDAQRIDALASGHFYRSVLPTMCDNGIISERRFMELVADQDASTTEAMITTAELLQLAILWGVTASVSSFWQVMRPCLPGRKWADAFIIAPLSANTLAKLADAPFP